jgi:hypothetical protein
MFENRPIGFVGRNTVFYSGKDVIVPFAPAAAKIEPKNTVDVGNKPLVLNNNIFTKTDSAQVNSLILKGNSKVGDINIFEMGAKVPGKANLAGIKNELPDYKIDDQGNTNSCGTTSLTSVLKYFGSDIKDHFEIDKAIRSARFDMFTAPGDIVSYAKSKGFKAGLNNNSTPEDLASFIDKGVPVIILIDPGDQYDFNMHWIVIKGYERNDKGEIDKVNIADPAGGWTYTKDMESLKKQWGNIRVGFENIPVLGRESVSTGYNNLMIPIVPKNKMIKLPDGKMINSATINIPSQFDSVHGYGARVVGKSVLLLDKAIGAAKYIKDKIGV